MVSEHVAALAADQGQGWRQVGELLLAFGLSSVIGLERQLRGKSAGLRTQAIVGTAAALILLVSKYAFGDVLDSGTVVLDPSRVAAQIISGIGFLGAGLILTRRGTIRGLTTAASVWGTAAVGMAAGGGLWLLALIVTGIYFVIVVGFTALISRLPSLGHTGMRYFRIDYLDRHGALRELLAACTSRNWAVEGLSIDGSNTRSDVGHIVADEEEQPREENVITVTLRLSGTNLGDAISVLGTVNGVAAVEGVSDEDNE